MKRTTKARNKFDSDRQESMPIILEIYSREEDGQPIEYFVDLDIEPLLMRCINKM